MKISATVIGWNSFRNAGKPLGCLPEGVPCGQSLCRARWSPPHWAVSVAAFMDLTIPQSIFKTGENSGGMA